MPSTNFFPPTLIPAATQYNKYIPQPSMSHKSQAPMTAPDTDTDKITINDVLDEFSHRTNYIKSLQACGFTAANCLNPLRALEKTEQMTEGQDNVAYKDG
eukprot:13568404-Ditylum_brightwellii.AAC.1